VWFLAYLEQVLCPTVRTGDIVVIDNSGSHRSDKVHRASEACGFSLLLLPQYPPDLNSIEHAFAKLKLACGAPVKRPIYRLQAGTT
jgi:transposase